MASYRVDDRNPEITYSRPASGGHWTENGSSDSYEGTLTFTRTRNANATVTFTGTSISVFGAVSKSGTGNIQSSRYSVDGAYTSTYVSSPTSSTQNQVLFYSSGTLPNGQHTLLLVNLVELDYLWIDYFLIRQAPSTPGSATTAVQQPPVVVSTTNKVVIIPSPSTLVVTEVLTSTTVEGSTTRLSVVTTTKSEVVQVTAGVSGTVSAEAQESSARLVSTNASTESTGNIPVPIGAIVGGVVGGIAVIILLLILIVLLKRKRKSKFLEGMSTRSGGASGSLLAQQSGHPTVVPFAASRPPPTVSSSSYTQSSTNPPSTLAQSGAFNQGYVAGGSAGVSLGAAGAPSVEMGKRQYMAQYLGNTQRQHEIEQDQNQSIAASVSDGTQYSEPLSTHPLLSPLDDSPPSYYQLPTPAGLGETGERIVADLEHTRKS